MEKLKTTLVSRLGVSRSAAISCGDLQTEIRARIPWEDAGPGAVAAHDGRKILLMPSSASGEMTGLTTTTHRVNVPHFVGLRCPISDPDRGLAAATRQALRAWSRGTYAEIVAGYSDSALEDLGAFLSTPSGELAGFPANSVVRVSCRQPTLPHGNL